MLLKSGHVKLGVADVVDEWVVLVKSGHVKGSDVVELSTASAHAFNARNKRKEKSFCVQHHWDFHKKTGGWSPISGWVNHLQSFVDSNFDAL